MKRSREPLPRGEDSRPIYAPRVHARGTPVGQRRRASITRHGLMYLDVSCVYPHFSSSYIYTRMCVYIYTWFFYPLYILFIRARSQESGSSFLFLLFIVPHALYAYFISRRKAYFNLGATQARARYITAVIWPLFVCVCVCVCEQFARQLVILISRLIRVDFHMHIIRS